MWQAPCHVIKLQFAHRCRKGKPKLVIYLLTKYWGGGERERDSAVEMGGRMVCFIKNPTLTRASYFNLISSEQTAFVYHYHTVINSAAERPRTLLPLEAPRRENWCLLIGGCPQRRKITKDLYSPWVKLFRLRRNFLFLNIPSDGTSVFRWRRKKKKLPVQREPALTLFCAEGIGALSFGGGRISLKRCASIVRKR